MMSLAVCRVCFNGNVRMHRIQDSELRELYETLSRHQLNTDNGMPEAICYICYWRLQSCYKFGKMAQKSESILTDLQAVQVPYEALRQINHGITRNLSMTPMQVMSFNDYDDLKRTGITVKLESAVLKEEPITDEEQLESTLELDHVENDNFDVKKETEETLLTGKENLFKATDSYPCDGGSEKNTRYIQKELINNNKSLNKFKHRCSKCNKTFKSKFFLHKHSKIHTDNNFVCRICARSFQKHCWLERHMRIHTENKMHDCKQCNESFSLKYSLSEHTIKAHHTAATSSKSDTCKICNKTLASSGALKTHMRIHTGEKPFSCNKCSRKFANKAHLNEHTKSHTKEKTHFCNLCNKAFCNSSNLRRHVKTHFEDKPFSCDVCARRFKRRDVLIIHTRTHT